MTAARVPVVYIAGPFRAATPWLIEQNVRRAEALSLEVWKLGAAALCPHTNTRFFQHSAPDQVWLRGTMEMLRRCDALIMVSNWEASIGTRAEIELAMSVAMPVFRWNELDSLALWIKEGGADSSLRVR